MNRGVQTYVLKMRGLIEVLGEFSCRVYPEHIDIFPITGRDLPADEEEVAVKDGEVLAEDVLQPFF